MKNSFVKQQKEIEEYLSLCYKEKVSLAVLYKDYSHEDRSLEKETITFFLEQKLIGIDRVPLIALIYSAEKEIEISIDTLEQVLTEPSGYSLFIDTITIEKREYITYLEELFDITENDKRNDYQRIVQIAKKMKQWGETLQKKEEEKIQKLLYHIEEKPWETLFSKLPKALGIMEYSELVWFLKKMK